MTNETNFTDFKSRLDYIISKSGVDKKIFAKQCGISENQIYNYLKRDQEPGTKFYRGLKENYPKVSIDWLISGIGNPFIDFKGEQGGNILDLKHERVIREFRDKECALEINRALVALERTSSKEFYKLAGVIQDRVERQVKYYSDRRRGADRRQNKEPYDGKEQRSGTDRRKYNTGR